MLCAAPTLRTAAIGCRIQPTLLTPCTYHTTSPPPLRSTDSSSSTARRAPLPKRHVTFSRSVKPSASTIRSASTASEPPAPNSTTTHDSTTDILDWNTFFKLRKQRRYWMLASSIGGGLNGFIGGAGLLARADMDPIVSQIPLDPFISMGLITMTCGGLGWLVGPIAGNAIFNFKIGKGKKAQMIEKEVEFYRRIKRYRIDPSASSMANPVPDYYGEKISSVAGYRQWLKDQRAFNKKRQTYV